MDALTEYALFAAKWSTVIVVLGVAAIALLAAVSRRRDHPEQHLEVRNLNDRYAAMALTLQAAMLPRKAYREAARAARRARQSRRKTPAETQRARVFVVGFKGDLRASAVAALREEITAVLAVARANDEIVVEIESPGGVIHGYGLASSQLQRVRDRGVRLTAAVDKVAASGGYLMASVADRIIAAPFAIVGSIGVIGQLPNFNRLLKKHEIDFEQLTAGEYKRTLSMFGENTPEGRDKFQADLEDAHALFKTHVRQFRPAIDIERVATGEHWFGQRALDLGLIDEVRTSDDYLYTKAQEADVYRVSFRRRRSLGERLLGPAVRRLTGGD